LQKALQDLEQENASSLTTDLRDERLSGPSKPIGLENGGGRWAALLLGGLLVLGGLEALSFWTGNGELFSSLLGLAL
jgi:hypothetical protein